MKISKFIIAFILFFSTTLLINIFSTNALPYAIPSDCVIYLDDAEEIDFSKIGSAAKKHDVIIYTVLQRELEFQKNENVIYTFKGDEEAVLDEHLGLRAGEMKDILGNTKLLKTDVFDKFDENETLKQTIDRLYLIGEKNNCTELYRNLSDSYGYDISIEFTDKFSEYAIPFIVFGIVLIVLLFTCYIDASFLKKEISIRVLHGESSVYHYIRCCLMNTVGYTATFILCFILQNYYTQILKCYQRVYLLLIPFLIAVWIVNLHILTIKPKEMLYGHQLSKKLIVMLRIIKNGAAVICCLLMLVMLSSVPKINNYNKAEEFFKKQKDYYFLSMQLKDDVEGFSDDIFYNKQLILEKGALYNQIDSEFDSICIQDISDRMEDYEYNDMTWNPVYCNFNALSYIKSVYQEAEKADLRSYDAVMLIPKDINPEEREIAERFLIEQFEYCEGYTPDEKSIQIMEYNSDEEIICFGNNGECSFTYYNSCAIIIASDTFGKAGIDISAVNHDDLLTGTIYKIDSAPIMDAVMNGTSFEPVMTNINDYFERNSEAQKSAAVMIIVIILLIMILYVSVLYTVLNLDYQINATELAVKKIVGYTVFQKNKNSFVEAIAVGILNFILTVIYVIVSKFNYPLYAIMIPFGITFFNIVLINCLIIKIEKQKLIKILKGGAL